MTTDGQLIKTKESLLKTLDGNKNKLNRFKQFQDITDHFGGSSDDGSSKYITEKHKNAANLFESFISKDSWTRKRDKKTFKRQFANVNDRPRYASKEDIPIGPLEDALHTYFTEHADGFWYITKSNLDKLETALWNKLK